MAARANRVAHGCLLPWILLTAATRPSERGRKANKSLTARGLQRTASLHRGRCMPEVGARPFPGRVAGDLISAAGVNARRCDDQPAVSTPASSSPCSRGCAPRAASELREDLVARAARRRRAPCHRARLLVRQYGGAVPAAGLLTERRIVRRRPSNDSLNLRLSSLQWRDPQCQQASAHLSPS